MSIETYDDARNGVMPYQQTSTAVAIRPRTVQRLTEWAESAQAAYTVSEKLVKTSFVPVAFRDKPHEATAAILAGDEVGLSPMASLRAFDVIQGTAAPKAITQRAVVQSRGHAVWQVEATDTRAIFRGRRQGETEIHESVWTIDRARNLGLLGKENWKKQPKAMLIARASSEVCRLTAADALLGIPYSAEELRDGVDTDYASASAAATPEQDIPPEPPPAARRTAQRRTQPRKQAPRQPAANESPEEPGGPPLPTDDDYQEPDGQPTEPGITKEQLTKLHTVFTASGVTNRDTRLQACCLIVGRELETSKDLTLSEASTLIDQLEQWSTEGHLAETVADLIGRNTEEDPE